MHTFDNTRGCIMFTLGGIPTIIRPSSWITLLILGSATGSNATLDLVSALIFVAAGMLCLLVHEYGHAFSCRALGGGESVIEIASLGGVTMSSYPPSTRKGHILMILAGPGASIALGMLGGFAMGVLIGHPLAGILYALSTPLMGILPLSSPWLSELALYPVIEAYVSGALSPFIFTCSNILFSVCVWWSVFNLLPIFPLDGGKALYLLTDNAVITSKVGIACAALLLIWCLIHGAVFSSFLCAYLLYVNWQHMRANS